MQDIYLGFKFAFSYFSILPAGFKPSDDLTSKKVLGTMLFSFPLVGFVLSLLSLGLYQIVLPMAWFGALISALAYMVFYGFIHTEAVIDVADALYASHSNRDAYRIIKEPTVGAMGVLWGILFVLLKVSGTVFFLMHNLFAEFVSITIISRMSLLLLFYTQAFRSSFLTQLKASFSSAYFWGALVCFTLLGSLIGGIHFLILLPVGLLFAYLIVSVIRKKLGFVNGDVLGTILESVEIVLFAVGGLLWL